MEWGTITRSPSELIRDLDEDARQLGEDCPAVMLVAFLPVNLGGSYTRFLRANHPQGLEKLAEMMAAGWVPLGVIAFEYNLGGKERTMCGRSARVKMDIIQRIYAEHERVRDGGKAADEFLGRTAAGLLDVIKGKRHWD